MIIRDKEHGKFETTLCDNGTINTVINVMHFAPNGILSVDDRDIQFLPQCIERDENGEIQNFEELSRDAVEIYIEENLA